MYSELAERIWGHTQFHKEYQLLVGNSLRYGLVGGRKAKKDASSLFDAGAVHRLLESAAILALSSNEDHKVAAYKISVSVYCLYNNTIPKLVEVCKFIFSRLGNFPAVVKHSGDGLRAGAIPLALYFEGEYKESENSIFYQDERQAVLTDFQAELWGYLTAGESLSVSAPTSAGKSFVLQHFLLERLLSKGSFFSLYLVPSRALISQVSDDIRGFLKDTGHYFPVSTSSELEGEIPEKCVFVLTPERAWSLLSLPGIPSLDLVVVDEAQLLGEESRGVLLYSLLRKILRAHGEAQIVFSSPTTSDISMVSSLLGMKEIFHKRETVSPVSQNLIAVEFQGEEISLLSLNSEGRGDEVLSERSSEFSDLSDIDKLVVSARKYGADSISIVYQGSVSLCVETANKIAGTLRRPKKGTPLKSHLDEISSYVAETVHENFSLVSCLKKGVAYHYGRLPAHIRKVVEKYIKAGRIKYVVSTSTLLYGVNLPAKNIFICKPTKGNRIPLSNHEFWNLIGRAGRLGKEFEGNVFLVDHSEWGESYVNSREESLVRPSLHETVEHQAEELMGWINNHHNFERKDLYESVFGNLYVEREFSKVDEYFKNIGLSVSADVSEAIGRSVSQVAERIVIPLEIAERHSNISVIYQQKIYDYLVDRKISRGLIDEVIPLHPMSKEGNPYQNLIRLIQRIYKYLEDVRKPPKLCRFYAALGLSWMRGRSLPEIINDQISRSGDENVDKCVQDTLKVIDEEFRFTLVKYIACYCDILEFALRENDHAEYIEKIAPLALYFESGACTPTMLNLMKFGVTRATANIIERRVGANLVSDEAVVETLKAISASDSISPIVKAEAKELLEQKGIY